MKVLNWCLIFCSMPVLAFALQPPYSLGSAPWEDQDFEICLVPNKDGLRPVIFAPELEVNESVNIGQATTKLVFEPPTDRTPARFLEKLVDDGIKTTKTVHLQNQMIGFLNTDDIWVSEMDEWAFSNTDFLSFEGSKEGPDVSVTRSTTLPIDEETEKSTILTSISQAPNCTYHVYMGLEELETEQYYDFGINNPFVCDDVKGYKRSQKFNFSQIFTRRVVKRADGGVHYFKMPDGQVEVWGSSQVFGKVSFQSSDKEPTCEWKSLVERLEE